MNEPAPTIRIAQVSDVHFGREHTAALNALDDILRTHDLAAMIVAGDLTQHGRRHQFRSAAQWLSRSPVPVFAVPGNHDVPQLNLPVRLAAPFRRYHKYIGGNQHFAPDVLALGPETIRGLNTARGTQLRRNWAEGSINMVALEAVLSASPAPTVFVCHHPLVSPSRTPWPTATTRGQRAMQRLANSTVEMVLSGHVHQPSVDLTETNQGSLSGDHLWHLVIPLA